MVCEACRISGNLLVLCIWPFVIHFAGIRKLASPGNYAPCRQGKKPASKVVKSGFPLCLFHNKPRKSWADIIADSIWWNFWCIHFKSKRFCKSSCPLLLSLSLRVLNNVGIPSSPRFWSHGSIFKFNAFFNFAKETLISSSWWHIIKKCVKFVSKWG